jgi:HPt (histidine-containing phosphotransfer) domain-containing protein
MDDFAPKPATLKDLAAVIERWDLPFDETALEAFGSVAAEGTGGFAGLLGNFISDARARLDAARGALIQGDLDRGRREAHAIKGAAAAVGARGMAELCRRLEEAAGAEREPDAAALLAQADAELARLDADAARRAA